MYHVPIFKDLYVSGNVRLYENYHKLYKLVSRLDNKSCLLFLFIFYILILLINEYMSGVYK